MKISDILARKRLDDPAHGAPGGKRDPVFSFEFFPPKTPKGEAALYQTIDELKSLKPDFVSVTYGAGGSTRSKTVEWVDKIKHEHGVETMAHLTCVGASRFEIGGVVDELVERGIDNVLALRGDPPKGASGFTPPADGFSHADQLVEFIRHHCHQCHKGRNLSVGVAGYPEKHPEAVSLEADLVHLRHKVAAGADFVITQLFFDNVAYFDYVARLKSDTLWDCDVIPGIMPITSKDQIDKFILMCGARIPDDLKASVQAASCDEEVAEIGVDYAITQVRELIDSGAPGIHFYTLNKSSATRKILEKIKNSR